MYSFGDNRHGQLGITQDASSPTTYSVQPVEVRTLSESTNGIAQIAVGDNFSVAVCTSGRVYTWGSAATGRLGHEMEATVVPSAIRFILGDAAQCERIPRLVSALRDKAVEVVYVGKHHVTAKLRGQQGMYSWGAGRHYLLGNGDTQDVHKPSAAFGVLGWADVRKMACGGMHSLILTSQGDLYALGQNMFGCLGLGYGEDAGEIVADQAVPVKVLAVKDIAAGWHVSAAVLRERDDAPGKVVTWGSGAAGALGTGDPVDHWAPVETGIVAQQVVSGPDATHFFAF